MKTIENKKIEGTDIKDYKGLLVMCVNRPEPSGMDLNTMRKRLKILDALECENIELGDDLLNITKEIVTTHRWPMPHKSIIEFVDYIESL